MPFGGAFGYLGDYAVLWMMLLSLMVHAWCFLRFFPKERKRTRLVLGNALVFACLLGVAAMGAETYLRFLSVATDSFGVSLPARRWFAMNVRLNSMGCRDREWTVQKPDGVRRIAFVGDSFTYGWGVADVRDRFTNLLEERFNQGATKRVELMNLSRPGWGTGDQAEPIADVIARHGVDEVVLCYVFNDIEKLLPTTPEFDPKRPPEPGWFNPDSSCLVDWLYRRLVLPRVQSVRGFHDWLARGYADPLIWPQHVEQLRAIARVCADAGVRFSVVLLPFLRTAPGAFDRAVLHRKLRSALAELRIHSVDVLDTLADLPAAELVVNARDAHPNETAHRLIADAIWNGLYR